MQKMILLCLHGWGGSKESFTELRDALQGIDIEILTPDLPGFGDEPEPKEPYNVDDYAEWVEEWTKKQFSIFNLSAEQAGFQFSTLHLLGHSHGGRTAIKIIKRGNIKVDHLYLCAAAGIRHPRHIKRIIGLSLAKCGKFLLSIPGLRQLQPLGKKLLYRLVRVHDYERASDIMRQTLINVSREDLRPCLKHIIVPTDLFWGTADGMTPYSDAKIMEREIPHATLHTYKGVSHRVHRDRATEIAAVIRERIL